MLNAWHASGQEMNASDNSPNSELKEQVVALRSLVEALQARVNELEKRSQVGGRADGSRESLSTSPEAIARTGATLTPSQISQAQTSVPQRTEGSPSQDAAVSTHRSVPSDLLRGTTVNILFDGYYGYNFNKPIGRVNYLRAYDISSNAFSLNQAVLVLENAADLSNNKRFGVRLDLQFGQATATLQGNSTNEPRPGIYRNVFQAYGTYVFPVGKGLTVDFGKFASSLGMEGNYTKDQMNYSRSYWFNFLPFYHMGIRATYKVNDGVSLNYWAVNGTNWTEAFNGFKDQYFGIAVQPSKKVNVTASYYLGQEHPDVIFYSNGNAPAGLPMEQGVPFQYIENAPTGKLHIFDS